MPVPERLVVTEGVEEFCVTPTTSSIPVKELGLGGWNVTEMVHEAPAATEAPQLLVSAKGLSAWIYAMGKSTFPRFVNWTDCGELLPRTGVLGNCTPEGDSIRLPARGVPLPTRKTVRGK
jgi:hypothetical protein